MNVFSAFMHKSHRVIGMIAIIPVIFLIVTGLLLEYRDTLGLHEIYPENAVVLWLYGNGGSEQQQVDDPAVNAGYIDDGYNDEPASYERVLTAFHAGRIRGNDTGFLLVFSAVILLALSLTGPYLWIKRLLFNVRARNGGGKDIEDELMESALQLSLIKSSARGLYSRAVTLHNLSEHVMEHVKGASGDSLEKEMGSIEGHMKDLDARMHSILKKFEKLGVKQKGN